MPSTTTLAQLRDRVLDKCDMTGSSFPVDARVNEYINDALSELHGQIVAADEDYFLSTQAIAVVAGTETYALPSDYYKTRKVWFETGGRRYPVRRFTVEEVGGMKTSPLSSGSINHWYIPEVTELSGDSDEVGMNMPKGWENYVVHHAAVQLLGREESDASLWMAERDRKLRLIINAIEPRDMGEADQIGDVYDRWGTHQKQYIQERNYRYRIMGGNMHIVQAVVGL